MLARWLKLVFEGFGFVGVKGFTFSRSCLFGVVSLLLLVAGFLFAGVCDGFFGWLLVVGLLIELEAALVVDLFAFGARPSSLSVK